MKESASTIKTKQLIDQDQIDQIQQALEIVDQKLDMEILSKQSTIERQDREVQKLHDLVEEKNSLLETANARLAESQRTNEGNRQLINKLLGDLDRLAQDVEWYKRTYEQRTLLGTLRQKLLGK